MPDPTHTLEDLSDQLGATTDSQLRSYFGGVADSVPIALGKRVATTRIVTDAPHIVGSALVFLDTATDQQKPWIAAITHDTLRLAIGATVLAHQLYQARQQALKASRDQQGEHQAVSEQVLRPAISCRGVLHGIVDKIACGAEPYDARIRTASNKSEIPLEVCASLDALIDVGRQILKDKNPGIVARRKTTSLTGAWLDNAADVSSTVRHAADRASAVRTNPEIAQPEVDLHDGWAMMLLDEIVTAFDNAHDADPSIPRLNVYSLRNVLRAPSGQKAKPPVAETPAATSGTP